MEIIPQNKKIILFDGCCNLCDSSVQFIIKRDTKDIFRFAAIESKIGLQIIEQLKIDTQKTDSIILYVPNVSFYIKSEAVFIIAEELGGIYKIGAFFKWIPNTISNLFYDLVAKNRYRWFGKKDACMLPSPEIQNKFL